MAACVDSSLPRVVLLAALAHYHLVLVVVRVRLQLVFFLLAILILLDNWCLIFYFRTSPIVPFNYL
jgi:hypothetical protein